MDKKVTVVGAGFVGSTTARRIVEKDLADVVLVDIVEGLPQGIALDLMESAPIEGFKAKIIGTNDYCDTKESDIVIITAGLPRKPGMSRDDLLKANAEIMRQIVEKTSALSPNAILIIVTNPLDVMAYLSYKVSGFLAARVIGMAGILDSARYRYFVAEALGVFPHEIEAVILGGHGDSMIPLLRYSRFKEKPVEQLLSKEKIEQINNRTRSGGVEIVNLLKKGSAYYAPSAAAVEMAKSILFDEKKVLPCSAYLNGEYGIKDVYCGVPVRLSSKGVEEIIEIEITAQEKEALKKSSETVRENINKLSL